MGPVNPRSGVIVAPSTFNLHQTPLDLGRTRQAMMHRYIMSLVTVKYMTGDPA